jgi:hypothetical protein
MSALQALVTSSTLVFSIDIIIMTLLPYVGSVVNLGNSFSQATRPKRVGQLSELIKDFRDSNYDHSIKGWEKFYDDKIGKNKITEASEKVWEYVLRIKENLNSLNKQDVEEWVKDLIIDKTFSGLQLQLDILEMISDNSDYRLANSEEEAKGIDGFVDGEPVSIKPHTYKKTIQSGKESIPYRIVYYKQTKKGLIIS